MNSKVVKSIKVGLIVYALLKRKNLFKISWALLLLETLDFRLRMKKRKQIEVSNKVRTEVSEKRKMDDPFSPIEKLAQAYVGGQQVSFMNSAVLIGDKVVFKNNHGVMDLDTGKRITSESKMRIFSLTKCVTATVCMILYDRGLLRLDDPITKFLPEFKQTRVYLSGDSEETLKTEKPKVEITIHHLLTHTSGLTYGIFGSSYVDRLYQDKLGFLAGSYKEPEFISALAKLPLIYQPGERFCYSVSMDVLGILMHRIVKKHYNLSFQDFMRNQVLLPLDMKDTNFYLEKGDDLCRLYTTSEELGFGMNRLGDQADEAMGAQNLTKGKVLSKPGCDDVVASGGGGLISTQDDYIQFLLFLMRKGMNSNGEQLVKKKTVELFTESNTLRDIKPVDDQNARVVLNGTYPKEKTDIPMIHYDQAGMRKYAFYQGMGWSLIGWKMVDKARAFGSKHAVEGEFGWSGLGGLWYGISRMKVKKNGRTHEVPVGIFYMTHTMPDKGLPTQAQFRFVAMKAVREYLESKQFQILN
eukprot:maker-scaffold_8-snap-gene-2.19-mRNA-1 protein AED:0.01 eAED:0.01 QI:106/1/1/1/1/1/2/244/525